MINIFKLIDIIIVGFMFFWHSLPVALAIGLDRWLGDPNRYHPIIFFGNLIAWGEKLLNKGKYKVIKGFIYNALLIALAFMVGKLIDHIFYRTWTHIVISTIVIFYMISGTTLIREVKMVFEAVDESLDKGRAQVARIVGRDTAELSAHEVRTAALETLSENLSDGVVAPLFWYAILGLPGILMYKMINTQDSMIGYKNERYKDYGYFSAKIDDLANLIPARLTAILMLLVCNKLNLLSFVYRNGDKHASPNSGYPEVALAGILNCRFGGSHNYFGVEVYKPYIGENERELNTQDMHYACSINRRVELMMLAVVIVFSFLEFILR